MCAPASACGVAVVSCGSSCGWDGPGTIDYVPTRGPHCCPITCFWVRAYVWAVAAQRAQNCTCAHLRAERTFRLDARCLAWGFYPHGHPHRSSD
eukprot:15449127-Alexandrium_andersonii.AAC.1